MKRVLFKRKKNNSGSTIIIVLLMTSFLLILATLITTTTMVNLRMKIAASQSTKSFYTAEEAVDEVYAALGKVSMTQFNASYEEQLTKLYASTATGTEILDNKTANQNLRKEYIQKLITALNINYPYNTSTPGTLTEYTWSDKNDSSTIAADGTKQDNEREKFVKTLTSYLEGDNSALKVKSIDTLYVSVGKLEVEIPQGSATTKINLPIYSVGFTNCVVEFKEDVTGSFSDITFDGRVGLPDVYIDFKDEAPAGTTFFSDYALVGNKGINVRASGVSINGNAYAGAGDGMIVENADNFTFGGNYLICGKKISFNNSASTNKYVSTINGQLWANDVVVGDGIKLNLNGAAYVNDDTTVEGSDSDVTFAGSYEGYGTENSMHKAEDNSSVIINGENSTITFNSGSNWRVIAGRAFINYNVKSVEGYGTGESYSENFNQEIYMIPKALITTGTNPSKKDNTFVTKELISKDNFFAADLLDSAKPYEKKTIIDKDEINNVEIERDYYYFNFKDIESKNLYAEIINNTNYVAGSSSVIEGKLLDYISSGFSSAQQETAKELWKKIDKSKVSTGSSITIPGVNTYVYSKNSDKSNIDNYNSNVRLDRTNRYDVFCKMLQPLGEEGLAPGFTKDNKYLDTKSANVYLNSKQTSAEISHIIDVNNFAAKNVFYNIINITGKNGFNQYTDVTDGSNIHSDGAYGFAAIKSNSTLTIVNGSTMAQSGNILTIPAGGHYIIVCDGNVSLQCDFDGILLTDGTITIPTGITVTNTYFSIENNLEDAISGNKFTNGKGIPFNNIFRYWNSNKESSSDSSLKVADMTYKQMVTFSKWRKYED